MNYRTPIIFIITLLSIGFIFKKNPANSEKNLLSRLVFHEASGLDVTQLEREAIVWVIFNRLKSHSFGNSITSIIFEKSQFSGVIEDKNWLKEKRPPQSKWERSFNIKRVDAQEKNEFFKAQRAVETVLNKKQFHKDPTQGAVFFHSPRSREYSDNECNRKDPLLKAPGWLCRELLKGTLEEVIIEGVTPNTFRFYRHIHSK